MLVGATAKEALSEHLCGRCCNSRRNERGWCNGWMHGRDVATYGGRCCNVYVATYGVLQQTVGEVLQPTGKVGATDGWTEAVATMQRTGGRRCNKRLGKCCTVGEVLQRMVGRCCNKCNGTGEGRCNKQLGKCCTVGEVLQQMGGRRCNRWAEGVATLQRCCNRWSGGVATNGRVNATAGEVLQRTGEVRRERCNRTLQYFTVDGLP